MPPRPSSASRRQEPTRVPAGRHPPSLPAPRISAAGRARKSVVSPSASSIRARRAASVGSVLSISAKRRARSGAVSSTSSSNSSSQRAPGAPAGSGSMSAIAIAPELGEQEGPGLAPVPLERALADVEQAGDLLQGEPGEEPQLHDLRQPRALGLQPFEGGVEGQQIDLRALAVSFRVQPFRPGDPQRRTPLLGVPA